MSSIVSPSITLRSFAPYQKRSISTYVIRCCLVFSSVQMAFDQVGIFSLGLDFCLQAFFLLVLVLGICPQVSGRVVMAFDLVDTFCLAPGIYLLAFGRVASMEKASDLVGISSLGLGTYLQASGHVVWKEKVSDPEVMMGLLEDRQQLAFRLLLLEPYRKLL